MITLPFNDEILENHLLSLPRDEMQVFVMADGFVRGAIFHGTRFVNQMKVQHKTGILETMILGQASLCGALMIPMMKDRGRMTMKYEVNGPAAGFSVDAFSDGFVRGFLFNNNIEVNAPVESWNLSEFLGTGTLSISSLRAGDTEQYSSSVEATHGNIAEDLVWYFEQSEQIKTAFNTSIFMDKDGRVTGAGGLFLQVMPEFGGTKHRKSLVTNLMTNDEILEDIESIVEKSSSLGKEFSERAKPENIIDRLFSYYEPKIAVHRDIRWFCPCTKETYAAHIRAMPLEARKDLRGDGTEPLKVTCQNCGSSYFFNPDEI